MKELPRGRHADFPRPDFIIAPPPLPVSAPSFDPHSLPSLLRPLALIRLLGIRTHRSSLSTCHQSISLAWPSSKMAERILMNEFRTLSREKWVNIEVGHTVPEQGDQIVNK